MKHYDVMIIGAGSAGICAAVQAGRLLGEGRVCLVEKNGICGGTTTIGGIHYPGIFHAWGRQVIAGIGWDLVAQTREISGRPIPENIVNASMFEHWRYHVNIDPVIFAACADEALVNAHVDIRFHTMLAATHQTDSGWDVTLCAKDGLFNVSTDTIIDCTGDANAAKMCGAEYLEPEICQPGTYCYYLNGFDYSSLDLSEIEADFNKSIADGSLHPEDMGWYGKFNANCISSRGHNSNHICGINGGTSEGRTQIELAGRSAVLRVYRFLRRQRGMEKIEMIPMASECGVRESRLIIGEHVITGEEYSTGYRYPDAVCHSFYPIDLHDSTSRGIDQRKLSPGTVPSVPKRALIPKGVKHLLVAGRCLSSDRLANSALRVQATCMATGQAAGAIAALSVSTGNDPRDLPMEPLRDALIANKAIVP